MSVLSTFIRHDATLQYRYGIYAAYAFVIAFYIVVLTLGRGLLPAWGVGLVIYTDPAAVGFFFLGALVMLGKGEGVRTALAVTSPSRSHLSGGQDRDAGSISSRRLRHPHPRPRGRRQPGLAAPRRRALPLAFVGLGIPIALRFRTVNGYLVGWPAS